jgi:hypothetical protein
MTPTLHARLLALSEARNRLRALTDEKRAADAEREAVLKPLLDDIAAAGETVQQEEEAVRAMGLARYRETGEKASCAGVTIAVRTALEYPMADALAWARSTGIALLPEQLDVKTFAKVVGAMPDKPGFVHVIETATALIATDLTKALAASAG